MYSATATAFRPGVKRTGTPCFVAAAISVLAPGSFLRQAIIFKDLLAEITSWVIFSNSIIATSTSLNFSINSVWLNLTPVMPKPPCSTLKPLLVSRSSWAVSNLAVINAFTYPPYILLRRQSNQTHF